MRAERVERLSAERQRVRWSKGEKTTEAVIGRRVILQLSAATDPAVFMRRHRLTASSPRERGIEPLDRPGACSAVPSIVAPPASEPSVRRYREGRCDAPPSTDRFASDPSLRPYPDGLDCAGPLFDAPPSTDRFASDPSLRPPSTDRFAIEPSLRPYRVDGSDTCPDTDWRPVALNSRLRLYRVERMDGTDALSLAAELSTLAEVEAALPDLYIERRKAADDFAVPPDDPRYRGQWYLSRIKLDQVWRVTPGDRETTIVVIDDGCDMEHPDLASAMRGGIDVIDEDDDASYSPDVAGNEHGTACAGIIAAVGNNGIGIAGACPRCSLRCVRLFDRNHALIPLSADIAAFDYVYETGAAVVSNSWGFADPQPVVAVLRMAIEEVLDRGRNGRGALVVFAAGNENRRIDDDEIAAIPGVVNVGAVNNFDEVAPFSNTGNSLTLTAPTGSLTTDISGPDGADRTDYTSLFGGTSSACPVVAGVGALLMSAVPDRTAREIGELLRSSTRRAPFAVPNADGHDPMYGYGILDPISAFEAAGIEVPEPPEPRDAGTPDASEPDAAPAADGGKDDSGCNTSGQTPGSGLSTLLALSLFALSRRRKLGSLNPCSPKPGARSLSQ